MRTFVAMYHKFCQDGFCSAAIAHLYFLQLSKQSADDNFRIVYNPVEAGHVDEAVNELITNFPDPENVKVLSFDLSFTYQAAANLFRHFPNAQVLDHHKTTLDCFGNAPEGVSDEDHFRNVEVFSKQLHFDNSRSGAALAFQFFFTDSKMPKLVEYVEDRDLWAWKFPNSKAISAGIYRHLNMYHVTSDMYREYSPLSFVNGNITFESTDERIPVFDKWIEWILTEEWTEKAQADGEIVLDVQNKLTFPIFKMGKAYEIDGQKVFAVNSSSLISELGNAICEWCDDDKSPAYDYALIWRYDAPNDLCYVSMRSLQDSDNDVEAVAKKNGGGGHKHAAGFEMSLTDLFRVFSSGTWKV